MALSITTSSPLTSGTVGSAYSVSLASSGGTGTVTFSVQSTALPSGLSISAAGVISGTPVYAETAIFTVNAVDSSATPLTASKTFTLVIAPAQFVPTPNKPVTVLNAVTGTGTSLVLLPERPATAGPVHYVWQTVVTGSPTVSITFQASLDGVNWVTLDTSTSGTGEIRTVVNEPCPFIRLNLGTFSGGTAPTLTANVLVL